jgi:hypothetical protein
MRPLLPPAIGLSKRRIADRVLKVGVPVNVVVPKPNW